MILYTLYCCVLYMLYYCVCIYNVKVECCFLLSFYYHFILLFYLVLQNGYKVIFDNKLAFPTENNNKKIRQRTITPSQDSSELAMNHKHKSYKCLRLWMKLF